MEIEDISAIKSTLVSLNEELAYASFRHEMEYFKINRIFEVWKSGGKAMMKPLEQIYQEISSQNHEWSYYLDSRLEISDVWHSKDASMKFIKDYFDYGGKSDILQCDILNKNIIPLTERSDHIVSTFLLGIKLAAYLGIENYFDEDKFTKDDKHMIFLYHWFLTCLYHDIGYVFENGKESKDKEKLKTIRELGIDGLKKLYKLKHVYRKIFNTYSYDVVDLYLKFRAKKDLNGGNSPVIDHGIVGGLLLHSRLRDLFEKAYKKREDKHNSSRENFYFMHKSSGRKLLFSNEHYVSYAKAADAIIAHNIWAKTLQGYIEKHNNNSSSLIHPVNKKIETTNPLCFLLAIADTIEPIKRFGCSGCLKYISIEQTRPLRGFSIKINNCLDAEKTKKFINDMCSMSNWIDIDVYLEHKITDANFTTIFFKRI